MATTTSCDDLMVGFESGDVALEMSEVVGDVTADTGTVHGAGTYSCRIESHTTGTGDYGVIRGRGTRGTYQSFLDHETLFIVMHVEVAALPTTVLYTPFFVVRTTIAHALKFELKKSATICALRVKDSGDVVLQPNLTLASGMNEIAIKLTLTGSNDISIWVNGVQTHDAVGDADSYWVVDLLFGRETAAGDSRAYVAYIDDVLVRTDYMPESALAAGGDGIEILMFQSSSQTGCETDWYGDGTDLDDAPPGDTGDYVYADETCSTGDAETVVCDGNSLDALDAEDVIEGIVNFGLIACEGAPFVGYGSTKLRLDVGSTTDYTEAMPCKATAWASCAKIYWINPDDDEAFTKSDLNSAKLGIEAASVPVLENYAMRDALVWLMVAREISSVGIAVLRRRREGL
jgi:hypothetical protein